MIETVTCADEPQRRQLSEPQPAAPEESDSARLIDDIYETIETPDSWEMALSALARAVGATCAALIVHERKHGHGHIVHAYRIAERHRREYQQMFAHADPWIAACEKDVEFGQLIAGSDIVPVARLRNSAFYRGFLVPLDILHTAHAGIWRDGPMEAHLLLGRAARDGPFEAADIAAAQAFLPHVTRAWRLGERRSRTETLNRHALLALDRLTIGVVLLDGRNRILAMNREAAELIDTVECLSVVHDTLEIAPTGRAEKIASSPAGGGQGAPPFRMLPAPRDSGRGPVAVLTWPVGEPAASSNSGGSLVFISDPYRQSGRFDAAMVRRLYAMTPAEARMASKMAHGNSLNNIAQELGISIHTARTHLKRIFEKTGVERQAALVHVLQNTFGFLRPACQRTDQRPSD